MDEPSSGSALRRGSTNRTLACRSDRGFSPPPSGRLERNTMTKSLRPGIMVLSLALGFSTADPAFAQDQSFRSADARAGKPVRLGIHGNVSKECAAGALPEIKVITPPKHGALSLKSGKTKAGELARCPKLEVPAKAVFYQSDPKYSGSDEVAYAVKGADGQVQTLTIKITVK